ncbi:hypothetical protein LXL04_011956 [Taraxacum kok-saghyz]
MKDRTYETNAKLRLPASRSPFGGGCRWALSISGISISDAWRWLILVMGLATGASVVVVLADMGENGVGGGVRNLNVICECSTSIVNDDNKEQESTEYDRNDWLRMCYTVTHSFSVIFDHLPTSFKNPSQPIAFPIQMALTRSILISGYYQFNFYSFTYYTDSFKPSFHFNLSPQRRLHPPVTTFGSLKSSRRRNES